MRHIIDILDLSVSEIDSLIETAEKIIENPAEYSEKCHGKKLATLFFEPSTRTRLSFEAAMLDLGGNVLGFSEAQSSSASKGESVADTVRTVSLYADIIAMRHPKEGAPLAASRRSEVPVINAGDGGHNHPTQTLTDLLTIEFVLISPQELCIPQYLKDIMDKNGAKYTEARELDGSISELDILYMTRVQRERFFNEADYIRLRDTYILTPQKLEKAKDSLCIMHPLPRVNEISVAVDDDKRACYFEQVKNGKFARMALILKLLSEV